MPASTITKKARCIYIRGKILQVKYKNWLIVRLKAIESRKNIFFYLIFYLHCNFFDILSL